MASLVLGGVAAPAWAQTAKDAVIQDMAQAYRKGDRKALTNLLPAARGHILEPWAAYWELAARLDTASDHEVDVFLTRYSGTYQEDRLRNDYLLLLGRKRNWAEFSQHYPVFRMQDDPQVRCYDAMARHANDQVGIAEEVAEIWMSQKDADEACTAAVAQQYLKGKLDSSVIWMRARLGMEQGRPRVVQSAMQIMRDEWASTAATIYAQPEKFLEGKLIALRPRTKELVTLALIRLAVNDVAAAREQMQQLRWRSQLSAEERSWIWAVIGKQAALNLSSEALADFAHAQDKRLSDDHLAWKARAALRTQNWAEVLKAIEHMGPVQQAEPTWVYWHAKALRMTDPGQAQLATRMFASIAGPIGFYEQLAQEELGSIPPLVVPPPIDPHDLHQARQNPGLQRALAAIAIGLRSEGVREWNYVTNLHDRGGMPDQALRAAAQLACENQIWDRCINTSERTRQVQDWAQRYPMPLRQTVLSRSREIELDPAYVYGLMRQESRFVMSARSGVGASGLMQIMPATARWTAKKIGMTQYSPDQLSDETTNIALGTAYLKLVLDEFEGQMALAAGAYNAGPSRVRFWRIGPLMEAPIWIENIPFSETRDYVKKVLANTAMYATLISGSPQSLKARLPQVGPRKSDSPALDGSMP
jgi:soluble lytic murein transglycosylase